MSTDYANDAERETFVKDTLAKHEYERKFAKTPKDIVKKGEFIDIKGYRFKVEAVGRTSIVLHFIGPLAKGKDK
jgi:hypothetical protein